MAKGKFVNVSPASK